MALIPWRPREMWWDPFRDLERIQNEINRLFDASLLDLRDRDVGLLEGVWTPAVDIYDSKDNIVVKADLPGMNKEEIDVSVHKNTLIIKGEKKREKEIKEKDFIRTERYYGSFNRVIPLSSEVQVDKVNATYKNGVLEITLPKKEEAKPKQLKIEVK